MNTQQNTSSNLSIDRHTLLKATGFVLREQRKKINKSQQDLADEIQISKTTISNIENGIKAPTIDTWFRLFSKLDLDISKSIKLIQLYYEHLNKVGEITSLKE
ncbi:MAG: helix-turn-helix transcriptional regulator [Clostridium perfringens]|nr:helix-turn-helix transcriptional regulator [Clostridium perfringens]